MCEICVICDHDITKKPRSSRMLKLLDMLRHKHRAKMHLNVISKACEQGDFKALHIQAHLLNFPSDKSSKQRTKAENEMIIKYCEIGDFKPLIFTQNRQILPTLLDSLNPQDVLIVEDITLLPFAVSYKNTHTSCKILIDLREFYPLEYENDTEWLRSFGRFFSHLCQTYLPYVDLAISVSEGLCERYRSEFHIICDIFYSLPPFFDITPKILQDTKEIKILYHGFISPDRSSMELLELAELLCGTHYRLYIMALSNQRGFLEEFCKRADSIPTLTMLAPVRLPDIIPTSAQYDIGLIPFKPTTFNLAHCMPNKLFEYIQSRLAILTTPLQDVSAFVQSHKCGVITQGFEVQDIAQSLLNLSIEDINIYKMQAQKAAQKWHLEANLSILENLLCNKLGISIE
ncbi:capsular biosynthesis protein [Helicobacter jaachi]|nr:capsular biosynthesis protein [Helicobacter jaachi]